ncbi:MAG: SdrD B-like domain-containing protein, partial [Sarcina sp.]
GEPGLANVTVNLYDCTDVAKTKVKYTARTDANGKYLITNVFPGSYYAVFVKPVGYNFVTARNLVDDTGKSECFTLLSGGQNLDVDAPLIDEKKVSTQKEVDKTRAEIGEELTYTITVINNGAAKIENVTVIDRLPVGTTFVPNSITIDGTIRNGATLDNDINIGDINPGQTLIVKLKVRIVETPPIPTQITNEATITFDGGQEKPPPPTTDVFKSSIGDFVWEDTNGNGIQDDGEPGIANATVKLYGDSNFTNLISTVQTAGNGKYLFDNLKAGSYYIEFIAPQGYEFTLKNVGGAGNSNNSKADKTTGKTDEIILGKNQNRTDIDAGLIRPATVGDKVWLDKNQNGILEPGEPGIANVTVNLYDCTDVSKTTIKYTARTNANGEYLITNVFPGSYYAVFIKEAGYNFVTARNLVDNTGKSQCFTLLSGGQNLDVDAPLIDEKKVRTEKGVDKTRAEIGEELTYTITVINNGAAKIENVTVTDKVPQGAEFIPNSVTVDGVPRAGVTLENGLNVGDINPGQTLTVKLKLRILETPPIPAQITNEATITFDGGEEKPPPPTTDVFKSSIGDFVWEDTDGNGIQGDGEPGIANATVKLYGDSNFTNLISTVQTAGNGKYLFDNLKAGSYYIEFIAPQGYEFTLKDVGGAVSNNNSKANQVTGKTDEIILSRNQDRTDIDAGLIRLATVGDTVWLDKNQNGILEAGEPGLANVTVNLYDCTDVAKTKVKYTARTDANGKYLITNVFPGSYYAVFAKPVGYNFVVARNLVDNTGKSECFTLLSGGQNLDVDAPLIDEKKVSTQKEVDKARAEIGEELTYTITIINNGAAKIENVTVIDRLPAGTTFVPNSITVDGTIRNGATLDNDIN